MTCWASADSDIGCMGFGSNFLPWQSGVKHRHQSVSLSLSLSLSLFLSLFHCPSVVCPSVVLSAYLSICLAVCTTPVDESRNSWICVTIFGTHNDLETLLVWQGARIGCWFQSKRSSHGRRCSKLVAVGCCSTQCRSAVDSDWKDAGRKSESGGGGRRVAERKELTRRWPSERREAEWRLWHDMTRHERRTVRTDDVLDWASCVCVCDARVQLVGPPTHACTPLGYGTPMLTRKSEWVNEYRV